MVQYDIMRITTGIATGFKSINSVESPAGSERYVSLSSIGIKTVDDKYLEIDSATLDDALQNHTDDVALLFGADSVGKNDTSTNKITYDSHVTNLTEAGTYNVEVTVSGGSITSAKIDGHDATIDGNYIVGKSGYNEAGLQMLVDTSSDGSYSAEIRLLKGVTKSLNDKIDDMLNSSTGPLNLLIDNYNGIIDSIDVKIDREVDRVTLVANRLKTQFALMEKMISELNGESQYLSSSIAKLPRVG
jgi:flagellar hook-associated protein 2